MRLNRKFQRGFTLIEMIVVMVIIGILGGIIAIFISGPVQGYVDSARRAEMNDIADTAMSRITRDLRTALPSSVRVNTSGAGAGTIYYLDFLSTSGGGRYRAAADPATNNQVVCGAALDTLDFSPTADTCFQILGPQVVFQANDQVVINSSGTTDTYSDNTAATYIRTAYAGVTGTPVSFVLMSANFFPTPIVTTQHFQIVHEQVRYICDPTTGYLTRYWWSANAIVTPSASVPVGVSSALLATNVTACNYAVASPLVTLSLTVTESGESISLYDTANVSNVP